VCSAAGVQAVTSDAAIIAVIEALEAQSVSYMLVGSLSANFYGISRATQDADFVVHLNSVSIFQLAERLGRGFQLDPQVAFETATVTQRHLLHVRDSTFQIELFLLSDDAHDQRRFARRRRVTILGRQSWVPAVEDVIITKLRWAALGQRSKDVDDVRNIIAVQGDRIDWDYVQSWCEQHGTRSQLDAIRRSILGE